MREKVYPTSLTQFIQLNSPHHGLLLNTSLHLCVSMLLSYFGMHRRQHFLLRHTFRTRSVLTIPGTPRGGSPSRPGIRVQSPVEAPQLLVHMVFLSFYLRSTLVNNLHTEGRTVVETRSTHVPPESLFYLGWRKRCTERGKLKCLSVCSWHTLSHHSSPFPQSSRHNRGGPPATPSSGFAQKPGLAAGLPAFTPKDVEDCSGSSLLLLLCRH